MEEKGKKMCKYANINVVKVSTPKQVNIIKQVMSFSKANTEGQVKVNTAPRKFNENLWKKNKK